MAALDRAVEVGFLPAAHGRDEVGLVAAATGAGELGDFIALVVEDSSAPRFARGKIAAFALDHAADAHATIRIHRALADLARQAAHLEDQRRGCVAEDGDLRVRGFHVVCMAEAAADTRHGRRQVGLIGHGLRTGGFSDAGLDVGGSSGESVGKLVRNWAIARSDRVTSVKRGGDHRWRPE